MKSSRWLLAIVSGGAGIALVGWVATTPVEAEGPLFPMKNGDVDGSGTIDVSDAIYLAKWAMCGGPQAMPLACEPEVVFHNGDVNGSNEIDVSDLMYLLRWLFAGGPPPEQGCLLPRW